MAEAERLARRALQLERNDPRVLANAGQALSYGLGQFEEGVAFLDKAVELDPNYALAWIWGGLARLHLGQHGEAIHHFERALRLSPLDPRAWLASNGLAQAHFLAGGYDDASAWVAKALRQNPIHALCLLTSVAVHAKAGRIDAASETSALYLKSRPNVQISTIREMIPFRRDEDFQKFVEGFRLAGIPE